MRRLLFLVLLFPLVGLGQFNEMLIASQQQSSSGDIPVIESTTQNVYESSVSTYVVNKPSGLVVGDLLLVFVANEAHNISVPEFDATSDPSGWTFGKEGGSIVSDVHMAYFWIIATSTETAASNFSFSSLGINLKGFIGAARISGVHTTPIGVEGATYIADTASPVITGMTTANNNSLAMYMFGVDTATYAPFTAPTTGWTETDEFDNTTEGSNGIDGAWGYKEMATAGATGTASFTISSSNGVLGWVIEIRSE